MSAFDKVVAEWLNGAGNNVALETKQDLLNNMRESIELYRTLNDHVDQRLVQDAAAATRPVFVPGPTPRRDLQCYNLFRFKTDMIDFDFEDSVDDALRRLLRYKNHAILFGSQPPTPVLIRTPAETDDATRAPHAADDEHAASDAPASVPHSATTAASTEKARASRSATPTAPHPDTDDELNDTEDDRRRDAQQTRPPRLAVSDVPRDVHTALTTTFPLTPKSRAQTDLIIDTLARHFLFSFLDDEAIAQCASVMAVRTFDPDTRIIAAGDANATLFLLLDGHALAQLRPREATETTETVALSPGSTFGDLGIMYDHVNDLTVTAQTSLTCATMDRDTYKLFTTRAAEERRGRYVDLLSELPFLAPLTHRELITVAEALKEGRYVEGDHVITRGATGQWLHLILHGSVDVVGQDPATGEPRHVATVTAGGYVGHLEFLNRHKSVADVIASSPVVRTARLSRHQFDTLIGDAARAPLRRDAEADAGYEYYRSTLHGPSAPEADGDGPVFDEPPSYLHHRLHPCNPTSPSDDEGDDVVVEDYHVVVDEDAVGQVSEHARRQSEDAGANDQDATAAHETLDIPVDLLPIAQVDLNALQLSPAASVHLTEEDLHHVRADEPAFVTHITSDL